MLRTPKNRITVIYIAVALYLTAPLVEWYFYYTELVRGSFPTNADSIIIPLFRFAIGWVLGAPVAALLVRFALRDYPGAVSFLAFNRARPVWGEFWTLIFGYLIVSDIASTVASFQKSQPLDVIQKILLAYLMLCLRSSLVYSKFLSKEKRFLCQDRDNKSMDVKARP